MISQIYSSQSNIYVWILHVYVRLRYFQNEIKSFPDSYKVKNTREWFFFSVFSFKKNIISLRQTSEDKSGSYIFIQKEQKKNIINTYLIFSLKN